MQIETDSLTRRRGPVAHAGRARVTVYLDESLAEWGKRQEGGLSDLLRRLLAEAHNQDVPALVSLDGRALARYHALVDRKLAAGLTAQEESEWDRLRSDIAAADRESPRADQRERAARFIDEEFARLRGQIEALPPVASVP